MSDSLAEKLAALSLKNLRAVIGEAGLSTDGCIDKADLRARAREAMERLKLPGAKVGPVSKPIVAELVAEELGIFDTDEEKARKAAEENAAHEAKVKAREAAKQEAKDNAPEKLAAAEKVREKAEAERLAKEKEREEKKKAAAVAKDAAAMKEAAAKEAEAIIEAMDAGDTARFATLLESLGPNCHAAGGETPLHKACAKGRMDMLQSVLAAGGDANGTNDDDQTPLHSASLFNRAEMVPLLLNAGADARKLDANGQTAIDYAKLNNHMSVMETLSEWMHGIDEREAEAAAKAAAAAEAEMAAKQMVTMAAELVGKQVKVVGLKARPECNGLVGYVLHSTDKGRCTVALQVGEQLEQLALKPTNLEEE